MIESVAAPSMTSPSKDQAHIIFLLGLCCFASIASMRACDTLLPLLAQEFSVSLGQAAQTIFVFAIAYGICQLGFGPMGDRYGKLRVIAAAALAGVFTNILAYLATDLPWLVVARVLAGACAAGIFPLAMAWIGDNVAYEVRQMALAKLISASVIGVLAGQWLSGMVGQWFGWRWVFLLIALMFLLAAGLLLLAARADRGLAPAAGKISFGVMLGLFGSARVRWILAVTTLEGAMAFGALAFIPSLLQRDYGVSLSMAGGITAVYGLGGFLYARLAGRLLGRIGESGLALLGGLGLFFGMLSLALVPWLAWMPLACFMAGFGFYSLHNTLQTNATQMAPAARGAAMSLFACCLFIGQSLGILVAAWFTDRDLAHWVFFVTACGLLLLAAHVARRLQPKQGAQAEPPYQKQG